MLQRGVQLGESNPLFTSHLPMAKCFYTVVSKQTVKSLPSCVVPKIRIEPKYFFEKHGADFLILYTNLDSIRNIDTSRLLSFTMISCQFGIYHLKK